MKATDFLRHEHGMIGQLLDEAIACGDGPHRHDTIERLATALDIHARLEDALFYPPLAARSGLIPEARQEHAQMQALVAGIGHRQTGSPDVLLKLGDLRALVQRHVSEEETAIFPDAERLGTDQLEAMGRQLEDRRHDLTRASVGTSSATRSA